MKMFVKGRFTLFRDQYRNTFFARSLEELKEEVGYTKADKMYIDDLNGNTYHCGYILGDHWLTAYQEVRIPE